MRNSPKPQPTEWCSVAQGGPMLHHPPIVWLGKTPNARNPRNWSGGKMPGHGDTVLIPAGAVFPAVDMSDVQLANMVVQEGSQVGTPQPLSLARENQQC